MALCGYFNFSNSILTTPNSNKEILRRLEAKRFERRLHSKEKKLARNRCETGSPHKARTPKEESRFHRGIARGVDKDAPRRIILEVPKVLDLTTNYDETAEFVRDIRIAVLRQKHFLLLDFNLTERIYPTALLLLLAEIHRCRLLHGNDRVTGTYPKSQALERLFIRTGFFELLGVKPKIKASAMSYPMEYIRFHSDRRLDASMPRRLREELLGDKVAMHPKAGRRLYRALTEAMINVGQHAYPDYAVKAHAIRGRWWMAGHVNKSKKELMITFCDLGVGIPDTLPKLHAWEKIHSALSILPGIKPNDGEMIKAGMILGRSRTREQHRGRGLNDLRSFIDTAGAGEMYIFSRKGRYRYRAGNDEDVWNSNISISGTFIKWTVPLACVTDWVDIDEAIIDD